MTVFNDFTQVGDWLKREADSVYSREEVIVLSGQGSLASGTVLGKVTSSGKYKVVTAGASDGSEDAAAILVHPVDATSADATALVVARDAIVSAQGLTYGADVNTAAERAAIHVALAALSPPIIVREGA